MRAQILERFEANLSCVRNLVALYRGLREPGAGRRAVHSADILRASTVLLHASLEDVFRGVAVWKFPTANEEVLDDVPLVGISPHGRPEKFFLGKLAAHRDRRVQELIDASVKAYAASFSVNNTNDIAGFCRKVGVDVADVNAEFPTLTILIERRHHVVHQADRNERPGRG